MNTRPPAPPDSPRLPLPPIHDASPSRSPSPSSHLYHHHTTHSDCRHKMPSQGYERVRCLSSSDLSCAHDPLAYTSDSDTNSHLQVAENDEDISPIAPTGAQHWPPASPPPSFHSRASSPNNGASRRLLSDDPLTNEEDRTLADTFDSDSDDDEDGDGRDDRQRLMRGNPQAEAEPVTPGVQRRVTEIPSFNTQAPISGRVYGGGNGGVWANLSAKPTPGQDAEEKPPVRTSHTPCTST